MKLKSFALSAIAALVSFSNASAGNVYGRLALLHSNTDLYTRTLGGQAVGGAVSSPNYYFNWGGSAALGYQYDVNDKFYLQGEGYFMYDPTTAQGIEGNKKALSSKSPLSFSLNGRVGYNVNDKSSLYAGAGFGVRSVITSAYFSNFETGLEDKSKTRYFPFMSATLGMKTSITNKIAAFVQYTIQDSFIETQDVKFYNQKINTDLNKRILEIGAEVKFN